MCYNHGSSISEPVCQASRGGRYLSPTGQVSSIEDLEQKLNLDRVGDLIRLKQNGKLHFISLEINGSDPLKVNYTISVDASLKLDIWIKGVKLHTFANVGAVTSNKLKTRQLCSITDFLNILAWTKNQIEDEEKTALESIYHYSECLKETLPHLDHTLANKVAFLCEQLDLLVKKRFSPDLLAMAVLWEQTSPSLYKNILADECLTLPARKTLRKLKKLTSN